MLDLLDREAVRRLVLETEPDAIAHEATALAEGVDFKRFAEGLARTNRLRTEGTENLLAAAKEAGVERFVAQSYGVMTYARVGGPVKTEDDPLDESLPEAMRATIEAVKHNETVVLDAGGIALRYGSFYGAAIDKVAAHVGVPPVSACVRSAVRPRAAPRSSRARRPRRPSRARRQRSGARLEIADGVVVAIRSVLNPDKLAHLATG